MTDAPAPKRKPKVARVPGASVTVVGACSLFVGALGVMGAQMATGHDPTLGAGTPAAVAVAPATRPVVVKRIVRRVVVTRVVTDAAPVSTPAAVAPTGAVASAPVVRTSAPVVVAAAPAPAPAPVQTRTS